MSEHEPRFRDTSGLPAEVLEHDCGCGSAWRWASAGETVLDLGCGSGKTCFLLSQAVGLAGHVIGVDASPAMLAVARRHQAAVARNVGWSNVHFVESRIEDVLRPRGARPLVSEAGVDLVVLDCVLTFVQFRDRGPILDVTARALRPGGRVLVSDLLRRDLEGIPEALALAGFEEPEVVEQSEEVGRVVDGHPCFATTLRARRPG